MTHTGFSINEHGTKVSTHVCDSCGCAYTVCPSIPVEKEGWDNCLMEECSSYDPSRDADILFMSKKDISSRKKLVSINMLRERKRNGEKRER